MSTPDIQPNQQIKQEVKPINLVQQVRQPNQQAGVKMNLQGIKQEGPTMNPQGVVIQQSGKQAHQGVARHVNQQGGVRQNQRQQGQQGNRQVVSNQQGQRIMSQTSPRLAGAQGQKRMNQQKWNQNKQNVQNQNIQVQQRIVTTNSNAPKVLLAQKKETPNRRIVLKSSQQNNPNPNRRIIIKTSDPVAQSEETKNEIPGSFLSNRTVVEKSTVVPSGTVGVNPGGGQLLKTPIVTISNLAAATTDVKIRELCRTIGPVQVRIVLDKY